MTNIEAAITGKRLRERSLLVEVSHDEAKMRERRETSASRETWTILGEEKYGCK